MEAAPFCFNFGGKTEWKLSVSKSPAVVLWINNTVTVTCVLCDVAAYLSPNLRKVSHIRWSWVISVGIFHAGSPKQWHGGWNSSPEPETTKCSQAFASGFDSNKNAFLIIIKNRSRLSVPGYNLRYQEIKCVMPKPTVKPFFFSSKINLAFIWPCWVLWLSCLQKDLPHTSLAFPGCTTRSYITPSLFHLISLHTFLLTQLLPHPACQ